MQVANALLPPLGERALAMSGWGCLMIHLQEPAPGLGRTPCTHLPD